MAQEWDRVAYVSSLDDDPLRLQRLDELRRWCSHIESYEDPSYYEEGRPGPDGEWWSSVDEAIEWARARTDVVLVRVGDIHYSAGALRAEDDADDPLPLWPPI
jgi:hypothetical protein